MLWPVIVGLLASGIGILTALLAVGRWVHRSIVKAVTEGVSAQLKPIHAEVSHNGGGSMKDHLVATSRELASFQVETTRHFNEVQHHLDRQDMRIDMLYRRVDDK